MVSWNWSLSVSDLCLGFLLNAAKVKARQVGKKEDASFAAFSFFFHLPFLFFAHLSVSACILLHSFRVLSFSYLSVSLYLFFLISSFHLCFTTGVLERPLGKGTREVSLASFAHLFAALVQQLQSRAARVSELETRLSLLGRHVGLRLSELLPHRVRPARREDRVVAILSFIVTSLFKTLFGRPADNLVIFKQKGTHMLFLCF